MNTAITAVTKKEQKLIKDIAGIYAKIYTISVEGVRQLACFHRDIGELVVRHYSPSAGSERRAFSELAYDERRAFRDEIEAMPRAELARLGRELEAAGVPGAALSATKLYECVRLACCYSGAEILEWTGRGVSMTNLVSSAALSSREDTETVLTAATEQGAVTVEDFQVLMDDLVAAEAVKLLPRAAAAKKAAVTKQRLREEAAAAEDRRERERKREPKERKRPESRYLDSQTLAGRLERLRNHLEDHLLTEMANLYVDLTNDFDALTFEDQDEVEVRLKDLASPLKTLIQTSNDLTGFLATRARKKQAAGKR
jgi:hypothetical protein